MRKFRQVEIELSFADAEWMTCLVGVYNFRLRDLLLIFLFGRPFPPGDDLNISCSYH